MQEIRSCYFGCCRCRRRRRRRCFCEEADLVAMAGRGEHEARLAGGDSSTISQVM